MNRHRLIQAACVVLVLFLVIAAGFQQPAIDKKRTDLQLTFHDDIHVLPPEIALSSAALGTFRGLAVDYLWIRASRLKEEGRYFDALQLADWICKLQPRFPQVWSFNGWNLAYNISVATHTPEERWKWVSNGYKLLRDDGIRYNPRSVLLYKELAWIILHKIGQYSDDMHWYYKQRWALMMMEILGAPPMGSVEDSLAAFKVIAFAPKNEADLREEQAVADYIDQVAGYGVALGRPFLDAYNQLGPGRSNVPADQIRQPVDEREQELQVLLQADSPARDRVLAFSRAKVLREEEKLDPEFMYGLMEKFGPLDWRLPEPHGLYWSSLGGKVTENLLTIADYDTMNTDRLIYIAMQKEVFQGGRLFFDPRFPESYHRMPELRMIDSTHEAYMELGLKHSRDGDVNSRNVYKAGHVNFLIAAVSLLNIHGQREEAEKYYQILRDTYREPDGSYKPAWVVPLEDFMIESLSGNLDSLDKVGGTIRGLLFQAYFNLALGYRDEYEGMINWAERVFNWYKQKQMGPSYSGRLDLPSFDELRRTAIISFMGSPVSLYHKAGLWRELPSASQRVVWDDVKNPLALHCQYEQVDFSKTFPPPPEPQPSPEAEAEFESGDVNTRISNASTRAADIRRAH